MYVFRHIYEILFPVLNNIFPNEPRNPNGIWIFSGSFTGYEPNNLRVRLDLRFQKVRFKNNDFKMCDLKK
jgi:hypothetical protein